MHSLHSDGSLSPQALLELACERGVDQMAITDHDTISAYAELTGSPEIANKSVKLITGCEFSCLWSGRNIHVVGLNLDLQEPGLLNAMEIQAKARIERAQTIADILSRQGFENTLEGAQANAAGGTIGRPHFAQYLIDAGYVKNMKQAFKQYLGAGKPGDIRYLMDIAKPQISVLLNAAPAHLANYENVDEIAQTKGEILDHLPSDGLAVINGEQQWTEQWRVRAAPTRVITIGFDGGCDYRALEVSYQGFQGASFKMACDAEQFHVKLNVPGKGGVHNALSAIAVAHALGISAATINLGLIQVNPASGRGLIHRGASGARIIDDSYNANPMAVCAAIDALAAESGVRTLVLGAMLELGAESTQLHAMVGAYAREAGIERLFAIGETTCAAAYAFGETAAIFSDRETAIAALEGLTTDDVVLIKGSRGAGLEVVVDALLKRQEEVVC